MTEDALGSHWVRCHYQWAAPLDKPDRPLLGDPRELALAKQLQLCCPRPTAGQPVTGKIHCHQEFIRLHRARLPMPLPSSSLSTHVCSPLLPFNHKPALAGLAPCSRPTLTPLQYRQGTRRQYSLAKVPKLCCPLGSPGELSKPSISRPHTLWIQSECLGWKPDLGTFTEELSFESWFHHFKFCSLE